MEKEKLLEMIANITVPACSPRQNSEYHLGYNDARMDYAEEKLKLIRTLREQLKD